VTLSASNFRTFDLMVDTILPGVPGDGPAWTTPGMDLGLAAGLLAVYEALPHNRNRKDLKLFLGLLDSVAGGVVLFGRPQKFTSLDPERRAAALLAMEDNRVELVRNGIRALKTLVGLLWVTTDDPSRPPPAWAAISYPGPDGVPPPVPKAIDVETFDRDADAVCDVVVVGSGAGGGTAAAILSSAGLRVIVLERGGYRNESDFTHLESDAYASTTDALNHCVLAGKQDALAPNLDFLVPVNRGRYSRRERATLICGSLAPPGTNRVSG